jgi:hypothetical protein
MSPRNFRFKIKVVKVLNIAQSNYKCSSKDRTIHKSAKEGIKDVADSEIIVFLQIHLHLSIEALAIKIKRIFSHSSFASTGRVMPANQSARLPGKRLHASRQLMRLEAPKGFNSSSVWCSILVLVLSYRVSKFAVLIGYLLSCSSALGP